MLLRRDANEIIALDVYHRADGALITEDLVARRIKELLHHRRDCSCGKCECAAAARPDEVLRVLSSWQESTRWQPGGDGTRIRELRAEGRTLRDIADEVGCSVGTVQNRLRLASQT